MRIFRRPRHNADAVLQDGFTVARSGDTLITQEHLQPYLHEIRTLAALPPLHFSQLYLSPISRYLALSQHCQPETIEGHLLRITEGLKRRRALLLPPGVAPEAMSEQKDLWTFVVFVLLLLHRVADQIMGYTLVVKKPGEPDYKVRQWCPFQNALVPPFRFKVTGPRTVSPYADLALLAQILTPECQTWLYTDSEATNTVFDLLASPNQQSPLGALLLKSTAAPSGPESVQKKSVSANPVYPLKEKNLPSLGQQFQVWLNQFLHQEECRKVLTRTNEGLALLCPDIFRRFLTDCAAPSHLVTWQDVETAFLALKCHQINPKTKTAYHQSQWLGRGTCRVIIVTTEKIIQP